MMFRSFILYSQRLSIKLSLIAYQSGGYTTISIATHNLHLVLKVNTYQANSWPDKVVLVQWHKGFKGTLLITRFVNHEDLNDFELGTVNDCSTEYRRRLIDISWFMRSLSEPITRQANKEDSGTGLFYSLSSMAQPLQAS
jgi:hypothetical protein